MAETTAGGAYLSEDGKTYHDANGKEVKSEAVAEAKKLQAEQSKHNLETLTPIPSQSTEALAQAVRSLVTPQPAQTREASRAVVEAETERRVPRTTGKDS